jgi:TRAP-type C4-dicarboxylate transport system substrate-binding protein
MKQVYAMSAIVVSDVIWNQFSPEQQEAVQRAATEAQDWQIATNREQISGYLEEMAAQGVQIHDLTDEEMDTFVQVAERTWDNMKSVYGEDVINALKEEVAAVRG